MSTIDLNFIVANGEELHTDASLFFSDKNGKVHEPVIEITSDKDMYDILVMADIFPSKGQARKNWTRTGAEIPKGFTDLTNIGKLRHRITILNPIIVEENL